MITQFHYSFDAAVYVQNNWSLLGNQTCTLKPRLLNVNVTYNRDGFVTLVPMTRQLPGIPTYMAIMVDAIQTLEQHFVGAQSISGNTIINAIEDIILGKENILEHWTTDPGAILVRMH